MYGFFVFLAGAGLLIGGIFLLRWGLGKLLLAKFRRLLLQLTCTPWRGLFAGAVAAAVMQSSTAVSLLTIGFVSAGYLSFYQGLGLILGANIGTCSTVQILTLDIPTEWLYPVLGLFLMLGLIKKLQSFAVIGVGLVCMFLGLSVLSTAFVGSENLDRAVVFLKQACDQPLYGILAGIVITFLCQSSSAATGILMVLAEQGDIGLTAVCYVVYGNNIGSCLSSLIAAVAAPTAAKRVAVSHVLLNVLGALLFIPFTPELIAVSMTLTEDFSRQVAMIHTLFNVLSSLLVMPVVKTYARIIEWIVPERKS